MRKAPGGGRSAGRAGQAQEQGERVRRAGPVAAKRVLAGASQDGTQDEPDEDRVVELGDHRPGGRHGGGRARGRPPTRIASSSWPITGRKSGTTSIGEAR